MTVGDEWAALDAWLSGDDAGPDRLDTSEPFEAATREEVNRALRRKARLERERDDVVMVAQAELDRIKAFVEDRTSGIDSAIDWIDRGLEGFMRAYHDETGNLSLRLPYGTISLRKPGQPRIVADDSVDEGGAGHWLIEHGHEDLVRETIDLDRDAIKRATKPGQRIDKPEVDVPDGFDAFQAVTADGEIVAGVVYLVKGERSFAAKPNVQTGPGDEIETITITADEETEP